MGCPCVLHLYAPSRERAESAADAGEAEVERLERKYTRYREESVTSQLNHTAGDPSGSEVDDETAALLDYAATAFEQSGGVFDLTSGILRRAWDLRSGRVPSNDEIRELLRRIGWQRLRWRRPRLVLPVPGMELDFGGIVKEYAADRVVATCRERGILHGLVDLGGDLAVVGPHPDGRAWKIGIRDPHRPETALAAIPLRRGAVATSGDYERCMVVDGRRYGHILNPRTGWPVAGLRSVSVVADHCLVAGTASTIAMLHGARRGAAWLDALGLPNLRLERDGRVSGSLVGGDASGRGAPGPDAVPDVFHQGPDSDSGTATI